MQDKTIPNIVELSLKDFFIIKEVEKDMSFGHTYSNVVDKLSRELGIKLEPNEIIEIDQRMFVKLKEGLDKLQKLNDFCDLTY